MVRCWSMTEEDSMRGVLVRAKRKESKKERRRKEKRKKISFFFFFLFSFFWKDQNERDLLCGFCKKKKEKKSRVTHQNQRKKKEKKTIIKYIPRARVEMSKRLQVQRRKRPRGGYTKRVRRLFWWSVFISHVCATFTAQTEHVFFLFLLCSKEEKKICPLSLSLVWKPPSKNERKREEMKMRKNSSKKIFIKNVAARALRKTSVLSFRVHHARDIFVMNRWRSSVFFIWTRMYLYITVYPPLLFCLCFFSSSSSSCFFGTLAKEVFAFSIKKKRKKEKSFFLRFSSLSFLVLSGAFERDKKKRALFFLLLSDANKRTNANASLRLKSTTGGRVQKDDARLKKVLFLFCCVVLCSCFWSGCCFVSRGEREKGTTKKAQKRKEKILSSVQKIRVPLLLLLFSVPKTRAAKERRGLQNKFWIVSKTFIAQL